MTTPALVADLKRDEGFRSHAYRDTGGVWTIGYGHAGADADWVWDEPRAAAQLAVDIDRAESGLDRDLPWWRTLDDVRQDALANMAFNLGAGGLLGFRRMLAALEAGDWAAASAQMLLSRWASQVGTRAARLAAMIRTGDPQ
jgi:lysozyme